MNSTITKGPKGPLDYSELIQSKIIIDKVLFNTTKRLHFVNAPYHFINSNIPYKRMLDQAQVFICN